MEEAVAEAIETKKVSSRKIIRQLENHQVAKKHQILPCLESNPDLVALAKALFEISEASKTE